MCDQNEVDMFEDSMQWPDELKAVIDQYDLDSENSDPYTVCRELLVAVEVIGFTFDYGLDGIPSGLKPLEKQ